MNKKVFLFLVTGMFILGMSKLSFAMSCGEHNKHMQVTQSSSGEHGHEATAVTTPAAVQEAVNVGNKICPVSGEKIDEKLKATYEYEGKIYNFCCAMCLDTFKSDPQKYIKKVEEELQAKAKGQPKDEEHKMEMMHE